MKPDDPRPEFVFDETVKKRDFDPDVPIPMEKLAWMREQLTKTGNVRQALDLAKLIDPRFAPKGWPWPETEAVHREKRPIDRLYFVPVTIKLLAALLFVGNFHIISVT